MSTAEFDPGRQAAMLEVLAGYQRGFGKLHPRDQEERDWFLERIRDLWTIVDPSTAQPARPPDEPG